MAGPLGAGRVWCRGRGFLWPSGGDSGRGEFPCQYRGGRRAAFHAAVADYLETCAKIGKEPQRAYSGQMMFRVNPEVHRRAVIAAELAGKSLNQWAEEVLGRAAG